MWGGHVHHINCSGFKQFVITAKAMLGAIFVSEFLSPFQRSGSHGRKFGIIDQQKVRNKFSCNFSWAYNAPSYFGIHIVQK